MHLLPCVSHSPSGYLGRLYVTAKQYLPCPRTCSHHAQQSQSCSRVLQHWSTLHMHGTAPQLQLQPASAQTIYSMQRPTILACAISWEIFRLGINSRNIWSALNVTIVADNQLSSSSSASLLAMSLLIYLFYLLLKLYTKYTRENKQNNAHLYLLLRF